MYDAEDENNYGGPPNLLPLLLTILLGGLFIGYLLIAATEPEPPTTYWSRP